MSQEEQFSLGVGDKQSAGTAPRITDPEQEKDFLYGKFPSNFLLGASTAAYQVEGGWNADGRGICVWDHLTATTPEKIEDGTTGQIVCDSYNRYKDDVKILKDMGAKVYRFSISWTRILVNGLISEINQGGIDYYNNLIDELLSQGIEPIVTLYHWDMPQHLAEKYTWLDEELVQYLVDFARVCFTNFGDRVKYWLTINEPWGICIVGYDVGAHPPFIRDASLCYKVLHNLLKAHAACYRVYEAEFKPKYNGKVGLSVDCWGLEPMDPTNEDDLEATERAFQFKLGCVLHPLTFGSYPPLMRQLVDEKSRQEGRSESRLPTFDAEWSAKLKGSYDFLGLNHYTCEKVTTFDRAPENANRAAFTIDRNTGFEGDQNTFRFYEENWPTGLSWWLKYTPWALRSLLNYMKKTYGNPEIIIVENGWSTAIDVIEDHDRLNYHKAYLNQVLKAVTLDGCNVTGYCCWTLLDSWEWTAGHTVTFGIHHVDLKNPERKRTPKLSAKYLTKIYHDNGFLKSN